MENIRLIQKTFIGKYLTIDDIAKALQDKNFKLRQYKKNAIIHTEEEICTCLEILLIGQVVNMQIDHNGNAHIVKSFTHNEIIAGNILFSSNSKFPLCFQAQTKALILQIRKDYLFDLLCQNHAFLKDYLKLISDRANSLGYSIKLGYKKTLRELILEYLHVQCKYQGATTITLPITKKDLSVRLGSLRSSVSREFTRMEKDGLIIMHKDKKTIEVLK